MSNVKFLISSMMHHLHQGPTSWTFEGRADIDPDPARCRPWSYRPDMAPGRPRPTPTRHVLLRTTTIYNTFFFIHKLNPEQTRCLFWQLNITDQTSQETRSLFVLSIIYDFCIASTIFVSIYSMFIQTNIHKELGSGTLTHNNDGYNGDSDQGLSLCRLFHSFLSFSFSSFSFSSPHVLPSFSPPCRFCMLSKIDYVNMSTWTPMSE